jgi:SOS-response transcriptional repressor LexA
MADQVRPVIIPNGQARVLLAVATQDHPTVRSICQATGHKSTNTVHGHLKALRRAGFVDWEDHKNGTLRALYRPVDVDL